MSINREKVRIAAQKYLQRGAVDKAIKEYERLVEDDPKDVRSLLKLGDLQTRAGDNAAATQTYTRVAQFYSEQGFFLKAVAVYKQILKIDASILEVNVKLADLYQQLGLTSDATSQYRQLAHLFEEQDRVDDCVGVLRKMLELDPENVSSRVKLAELYARQSKIEEAKKEFRESAAFLRGHNRVDDWVKVAERMVFFHPEDIDTTRELAQVYLERGDARHALAKLQICFKQNPRDPETLELLGSAFRALEQPAKAVAVYKELARLNREAHQPELAAAAMAKVLELDPEDAEAREALGRPSSATTPPPRPRATGPTPAVKPKAAISPRAPASAKPATTEDATSEQLSSMLVEADVYLKYGLRQKALAQLERAIALAPDHREAHDRYKALLLESGDLAGAVAHIFELARLELARGNKVLARDDLEELLGIDPGHTGAGALLRQLEGAASPPLSGGVIGADAELEIEPEEAAEGDDVPMVVRAGAPSDPMLAYEPSPEAAGIDLDEDEVLLEPVAAPVPPPTKSIPALTTTPATKPSPGVKPAPAARPARPAPRPVAGMDDLDALLASAVPTRSKQPATPAAKARAPQPAALEVVPQVEIDAVDLDAPEPEISGLAAGIEDSAQVEIELEAPEADAPHVEPSSPTPEVAPERPAVAVSDDEVAAPSPAASLELLGAAPLPAEDAADLSEELEEVRFYAQQGLADEAREAAAALAHRHPDHPDVRALLLELEGATLAPPPGDEAEPVVVAADPESAGFEPEPVTDETGEQPGVELAQELEGAFASVSTDELQAEIGDLFDEFKRGVAEQVDESDHATHYDLGIAYKEMGLLDDAIREFGIAQRSSQREVVALTMIGLCRLEQGDTTAALESFQAGLSSERTTRNEAVALRYEIAQAYEGLGRFADALRFYEKVRAMDPSFRDAAAKIELLRPETAADEEIGHELDELLDDKPTEAAPSGATNGRPKISYL